jgi:hypothetical protein
MDRFKFRAWNCYSREYWDDELICLTYDKDNECVQLSGIFEDCTERDTASIIEQCTGLKDSNGKLIYEGDVLEFQDDYGEDGIIVKVVWGGDDKYPAFDVSPNDLPEINGLSRMIGTGVVTVIGNIHENQDLLSEAD